jgi:proton-coupled amino acid transporter
VKAFGGLSVLFYGMGVAIYSFEGVGMVLPLESEMKDKDKFGKVLALTMAFISLMYGGFGELGYLLLVKKQKI